MQNVFPPSFEESVLLRDTHCFITGTESSPLDSNLGVSWIVGPAWVDLVLASYLTFQYYTLLIDEYS